MAKSIQINDKTLNKSLLNLLIFLYRHNTDKFSATELNKMRFFSSYAKLEEGLNLGIQKKLIKKAMNNEKPIFEIKAEANELARQIYLNFY